MVKKKHIRSRGKIPFSKYFQSMKTGDTVAVVKELSVDSDFPERLQGRTGTVIDKRGRSYVVKIKDMDKEKTFIIEPVHLRRIK